MTKQLFAVTRSFQGGATFASFDSEKFDRGVVAPVTKLLSSAPEEFAGLAIVTCGEPGNKYSEEVIDGETPTVRALREAFSDEIAIGRIIPVVCSDWGLNAGSATAINAGVEVARSHSAHKVLVWSPEIDLSGHMVSEMLNHMEQHALRLVGYMRNRWYQRLQWAFAQNTCAIWDMGLLDLVSGMNPSCNGDGKTTVSTLEFGEVPLAGMEDIEAYFRASAICGEFIRWGCVGMRHPAIWSLALKKPDTREYDDNIKKIARQALVMDAYAKRIFPDIEPIDVYDQMMRVVSFA